MQKIQCELCNGVDFVKEGDYFVCQFCGCKYSIEQAREIILGGTVKIDKSEDLSNYLELARSAHSVGSYEDAIAHSDKALEISAHASEAWLIKALSLPHLGLTKEALISQMYESGCNALKYAPSDERSLYEQELYPLFLEATYDALVGIRSHVEELRIYGSIQMACSTYGSWERARAVVGSMVTSVERDWMNKALSSTDDACKLMMEIPVSAIEASPVLFEMMRSCIDEASAVVVAIEKCVGEDDPSTSERRASCLANIATLQKGLANAKKDETDTFFAENGSETDRQALQSKISDLEATIATKRKQLSGLSFFKKAERKRLGNEIRELEERLSEAQQSL